MYGGIAQVSSEIKSCIGNGKFHIALPRKFVPISNATLVVFIQNFTATHAITIPAGKSYIAS